METRSQQVRRRERRVLFWSMAVAAAFHVGLFVLTPAFNRPLSEWSSSALREEGESVPGPIAIHVTFGPPNIRLPSGEDRREPPDRVLEARDVVVRHIPIHTDCDWMRQGGFGRVTGVVRLVVGEDGRVREAEIEESFGDNCTDQGLVAVSGRLWYHWIPNEEVPAPVHLSQPMTVESAM